jgi:2-haloacid dehalogenase
MQPRSGSSTLTVVVFDIGGIFLDWHPRHLYRKMFDDETRMEWFLEHICTAE